MRGVSKLKNPWAPRNTCLTLADWRARASDKDGALLERDGQLVGPSLCGGAGVAWRCRGRTPQLLEPVAIPSPIQHRSPILFSPSQSTDSRLPSAAIAQLWTRNATKAEPTRRVHDRLILAEGN